MTPVRLPAAAAGAVRDSTCVVTGGLGFIGSNVVHALVHNGARRVTVVDALVDGHGGDRRNLATVADAVEVIVSPIDDARARSALVGTDLVFNLAGQVSHHASMVEPVRDLDLNARTQLGFLELLREAAPEARVVYSSTRQVYGRPRYLPVDEDHPTAPVDVNGISKLAGEQAHLLYASVHGLAVTALRLTNVYGPRQCLRHDGLGFLPVFFRKALRDERIEVFGTGRQLRDCLYVDDVVRALVVAVTTPEAAGELFNLGHPEVLSLARIADTIVAAAGAGDVALRPWPADLERIDIGSFHGDFSKAKRVLGWEPDVDFAEGVRATLEFYRDNAWYLSST